MARKIIVYIATSADGYIARPDGGIEWLNRPRVAGDYGMKAFLKTVDTVLWGRKTYDIALRMTKGAGSGFGPGLKNYVFSRKRPARAAPDAELVSGPVRAFAKRLRAAPGKDVWMMGGAALIGSFLDEGEIDEFIIHVIPTFIGDGIPLIAPGHRTIPLALLSSRRYSDGVVRLHYAVARHAAGARSEKRGMA